MKKHENFQIYDLWLSQWTGYEASNVLSHFSLLAGGGVIVGDPCPCVVSPSLCSVMSPAMATMTTRLIASTGC